MRKLAISILLLLVFVPSWSREPRLDLFRPGPGDIRVTPIVLDPRDPQRRRVGELTFLWGARLSSPDRALGGFSALAVEGDRFTMISDGGGIARFRLAGGAARDVRFADLPAGPGGEWHKEDRDSDSLAFDRETGDALVGFERWNAIWRYDVDFTHAIRHARPPAMRDWPAGTGAETLIARRDGSFVVIAEADYADDGSGTSGLVFAGDPTRMPVAYGFRLRPPVGWRAVDGAELPDGRILILLRRLVRLRFETAVMELPAGAIKPDAMVRGRILARLARPLAHDNFEGLAIAREGSRTIVWIVSDDNQSIAQATLLLKFAMD